ncbi:hypothetical protein NQ315_000562 [Exocentrus adspersus]|uniref:Gustatory receptor n=1 Tax=Exocentrus adspersus TaxID=1586481 RepID=A0AAV8VG92_9CUCU|nr:hypothetical protein NQ315_000562 [Exocentrus adspersus]
MLIEKTTKLFQLHALLLACLLPVISVISLYFRYNHIFHNPTNLVLILDFLLETVSLFSFENALLGSSFWNMKIWQQLFHHLRQLERRQMNLKDEAKNRESIITNVNFLFLVGTFWLSIFIGIDIYYLNSGIEYYIYASMTVYLYCYAAFIQLMIVSNIVICIKNKYQVINNAFENMVYSYVLEMTTNIRRVTKFYLMIDEIMWPLVMTFCCSATVEESRRMLVICYKLELVLPPLSKEREELKSLENILNSKPPRFTAARFFEIDRSTLLLCFSAVTTNLLVALQFSPRF